MLSGVASSALGAGEGAPTREGTSRDVVVRWAATGEVGSLGALAARLRGGIALREVRDGARGECWFDRDWSIRNDNDTRLRRMQLVLIFVVVIIVAVVVVERARA